MRKLFCLCAFIAGSLPSVLLAEEDVGLEKIVVSSSRAASDAVVVGGKRIEQLPARNLAEVLTYTPALDVEPRQGFGRATNLGMQGADSSQVRFMVDDIPFNSLSSGQVDPSQFAVENVQRIEVLKGASSSLWGSGLGGSVNVVTKDIIFPDQPQFSYTSSAAELRTRKQAGEVSAKAGALGYYLFSSFMESGGKGLHDDVKEKKVFAKFARPVNDNLTLYGSAGLNEGDINSGVFPDDSWQAQPYRTSYGKIALAAHTGETAIDTSIKHSRQRVVSNMYYFSADTEPAVTTSTDNLLYQYSISASMPMGERDTLLAGADLDWNRLRSTYLPLTASQETQGLFARYTKSFDPLTLHAGVRYDHDSVYGQACSPELGVAYQLDERTDTLVRFNAARTFNAPPLLWRFFGETLYEAPNPDLKPEHAWVYEFRFQSRPVKRLLTKMLFYCADVSDAISAAYNDDGKITKKNFRKFHRQGAELETVVDLLPGLQFNAFAAFNDIRDASANTRVRLASSPRHRYGACLDYTAPWGMHAGLQGYYNRWGRAATSYYNLDGDEIFVDANDRTMLFDLKLSQGFRNFSIFVNVFNLFDSDYWIDYYYPATSRYVEGGLTVNW